MMRLSSYRKSIRFQAVFLSKSVTAVGLFLALSLSSSFAASLADFTEYVGPQILPENQYAEVQVQRLKKARLVWVNWDMLREYGIDVPTDEASRAALMEELLEAFAWAAPNENERTGNFLNRTRTLYADRYGGFGIGTNMGSGRAAAFLGRIPMQIKGAGQTPLADPNRSDHNNGSLQLEEALREAIYGEILNRELPFGASRTLLIIDRGTSTKDPYGQVLRDALAIRPEPIRPAHFVDLPLFPSDQISVNETKEALKKALGLPPTHGFTEERLFAAWEVFGRKVAEQYARAFVGSKIVQLGTTQSNIEINAKFMDYGVVTAQPEHGKAHLVNGADIAGDMENPFYYLIKDFLVEYRKRGGLRVGLRPFVARSDALVGRLMDYYESVERQEYLRLVGWPQFIVSEIFSSQDAKRFSQLLRYLATKGAEKYNARDVKNDFRGTTYEFGQIIEKLISNDPSLFTSATYRADRLHIQRLADLYLRLQARAIRIAEKNGISKNYLSQFVKISSQMKNKQRPDLYRWKLISTDQRIIDKYLKTGDANLIQNYVDKKSASNVSYTNDEELWRLVDPTGKTGKVFCDNFLRAVP